MNRSDHETERLAKVRCFLLDMDGTLFLGNRLFAGSRRFLEYLEQQGRHFLIITNNSSQNGDLYAEKITRMGVKVDASQILTSGEATALFLTRQYPGASLFVVGTPALEGEFRHRHFTLTAENPDVALLGFDTTLTYEKLCKLCDLVRAGRPYIATHPDINCPIENGCVPDTGAMIAFVKAATGWEPDTIVGKPNRLIVDIAAEKMGVRVCEMAVIGDRLYTDIALGMSAGIPAILVLSGETRLEDLRNSPFQPTAVFQDLGALAGWLESQAGSEMSG